MLGQSSRLLGGSSGSGSLVWSLVLRTQSRGRCGDRRGYVDWGWVKCSVLSGRLGGFSTSLQ